MSFEAHEQRLKQIFSGDSSFEIPRNQRDYVWDEKNWREFAEDIKYIKNKDNSKGEISHFIGSFVFQQDVDNNDRYIIIDGQQRITTIMIMLAAICTLQNELGDDEEFGVTKQYLLGNIGLKSEYQRLNNESLSNLKLIVGQASKYTQNLEHKKIFSDFPLSKSSKSEKTVIDCFWFFYNSFFEMCEGEKEKLAQIRSIIVDMKVIHIISQDELDCYEVFEILNARGVSLKDSELLKNYVFKYVQPEFTVDIAKIKWNKIVENMGRCKDNIDQFLVHYFVARFPKKTTHVNVFEIVKNGIPKDKVMELLDELVECSNLYVYFYNPSLYNNTTISECLEFFNMENQRQFRPVFLAFFLAFKRGKISESELEKVFILIRNFYFSFGLVCKNTSNLIENGVYKVANEVYNATNSISANVFGEVFQKYLPSKETFINNFVEKGYSNKNKLYTNSKSKKETKYILYKMEEYYQIQNGGELVCNMDRCNVEHINCDSDLDDSPCKVGNLLLLSSTINKSIEDKAFSEKVSEYKKSNLLNVKKFVEYYGNLEVWSDENIIKRARKMAELAYNKIWPFSY